MKQQTSCTTETHYKSSKTIDYTGKTIHLGIDVHLKDWQIASVNKTVVLGNHRMQGKVANSLHAVTNNKIGAWNK